MPKTKPMPGSDAFWALPHKERFERVFASAVRGETKTMLPDYPPGGSSVATIYRCPVCGESGQQGYAGTPPCFEARSKKKLATLKRKGCVKGIALHTCSET